MSQPAAKVAAKAPAITKAPKRTVQAKCACGGQCEECRKKKATVMRSGAGPVPSSAPGLVGAALRSPGHSMDAGTRSFMESRFNRDFGGVRIHTDSLAGASARSIDAHAYAVGQDIVFAPGRYQPSTAEGRRLLAHELAHTVQQHGLQPSGDIGFETGSTMHALEAEADHAADRIMAGGAAPAISYRPMAAQIARTAATTPGGGTTPASGEAPSIDWQPLTNPVPVGSGQNATHRAVYSPQTVAYKVDKLKLPREKGPVADKYRAQATSGSLRATIEFTGGTVRTAMWQRREATQELRNNWMLRYGIDRAAAAQRWRDAGGADPGTGGFPDRNPRATSSTCDIDHIVELQIGGTNVPDNLQVLNSAENQGSGRSIWDQVSGIATELRARETDPAIQEIVVHFSEVEQVGGDVAWPAAPAGTVAAGSAASCTAVEAAIRATAGNPASLATAAEAGWEGYDAMAGGQRAQFLLPPVPSTGNVTTPTNTNAQNVAASEVIPGMIVRQVTRRRTGADQAQACIETTGGTDPNPCVKRTAERGTRVPITITRGQTVNLSIANGTDGRRISLVPGQGRGVRFTYPYLSEGTMNFSLDPEQGLKGTGTLTPSLPLLRSAQVTVEYGQGVLRGTLSRQPRGNVAGIPGLRITRSELGLELSPEFRPYGVLEFAVGRVITGSVNAEFDGTAFVMRGQILATIPGCDQAEGTVTYRNGELTGEVNITTEKIRLPGNPQGSLNLIYRNGRTNVTGQVTVTIANQEVTLGVRGSNPSALEFFGRGRFTVPGINPVNLDITYSQARGFRGTGRTGFTLASLRGDIDVLYENGRFSGTGTVAINRGRAIGNMRVVLSPAGRLSGDGRLTYQLTPNLTGEVGIVVSEDRQVRLSGELRFAQIEVFRRFAYERTFAGPHIQIPLLAIPLGVTNIGLVATVDGGVTVEISFGPGQLRNTRIGGAFNPFDENSDVEISASSQFYVPARIAIGASIRGGLGVSAGIAEVTGGIRATGTVGLNAENTVDVNLNYRQGNVNFTGAAEARITPTLGLRLDADINARAGWGPFSVGETWTWNLANYQLDTGLTFSARAEMSYSSDRGIQLPSLDQIQFRAPDIDARTAIQRLMRAAQGTQG